MYKLPQSGNYYVMKLWNSINSTKGQMIGSHYKDRVVMQEIDPNSFLCNYTQIASKRANTCDHAKLLSHASGLIKEAPVLDITDGDTLLQFPGKCFLCIAVEIDEPLSPIVALTLANRLVNGHKLITCSLCQKLYGKTVEAHCDHKKILVSWRSDIGVIDKKSKKKKDKVHQKNKIPVIMVLQMSNKMNQIGLCRPVLL